jgi:hypothetical protein
MASPAASAPATSGIGKLTLYWSVRLPRRLDRWVPRLADAFADGAWLTGWRLSGVAPLVALTVGLLSPWVWPGITTIYSESALFLGLLIGASIASGAWGAMLLLGYIAGDVLHTGYFFATSGHYRDMALPGGMGHLVAYLLLAILVIRLPQFARRLVSNGRPVVVRAVRYGVVCAGLVFLWCQAMIVLIRPVFTWRGDSAPKWQAVKPIQTKWPWLVALAFVVAVARIILEDRAAQRSRSTSVANELRQQRRAGGVRRGILWRSQRPSVQVALRAMFVTLLLAGMYVDWMDAIAVLFITAAVGAWRAGLMGNGPQGWIQLMGRIPVFARATVAVLLGFLISSGMLTFVMNRTDTLRPLMVGALATVVVFALLFPRSGPAEESEAT